MATEIIECEEFGEVSVRLSSLMRNGELTVDPRIASKGYLTTAFRGGQVILRATKFVGTIPLTPELSIRVKPRADIKNLSYMLTRSQKAPTAISGFARGYVSKFVRTEGVEKLFGPTLVEQVKATARRGLAKRYMRPAIKVPWRGRFLAAETVRKHASKGIRYRHEFDQNFLTDSNLDNFALKESLKQILAWWQENDRRSPFIAEIRASARLFDNVTDWTGTRKDLVYQLRRLLSGAPKIRPDYLDALWSAYAILESSIPDLDESGGLHLDSLILDVSEVFEAYLRRELSDRLRKKGFGIYDGWKRPYPFFADGNRYTVHPDMIICRGDQIVAILDAKYKPDVSVQDRYEVLSFMDVMQVNIGGFVCPAHEQENTRLIGVTSSGKRLHTLRFDLAAADPLKEADRFARNVETMIESQQNFD